MLAVVEPVRPQLIELLLRAKATRETIAHLVGQQTFTVNTHATTTASLNFRERKLGGRFGGDRQKIEECRRLAGSLTTLEISLREQRSLLAGIEADIFTILDTVLQNDSVYALLYSLYREGYAAQQASEHFMALTDQALCEAEAAGRTCKETDYEIANYSIGEANRNLPIYVAAVQRFLNAEGIKQDVCLHQLLSELGITGGRIDFHASDFRTTKLLNCAVTLHSNYEKADRACKQIANILKLLVERRHAIHDEVRATLI